MASYSTRQRDPLLDSNMQAMIEKRSKELLGLGLIFFGVLAAMMIGSYSPEDPNWMLATDAPVQNWLGRFGATLAAPLVMIVGKGAWGIALTLIAWGIRLTMHMGGERIMGRVVFAPIMIAVFAIYCATLTPAAEWTHSFGVGGLFGDTVLSILLTIIPVSSIISVKLVSLLAGAGALTMMAFCFGFTKAELRTIRHFVLMGMVVIYTIALRLMGRGAEASFRAAQGVQANVAARREQSRAERELYRQEELAMQAVPDPMEMRQRAAAVVRANPNRPVEEPRRAMPPAPSFDVVDDDDADDWSHYQPEPEPVRLAPAPKVHRQHQPQYQEPAQERFAAPVRPAPAPEPATGLSRLMPKMLRRQPEPMPYPELVEVEPPLSAAPTAPDEDRIKSRISDAIRNRSGKPAPTEPKLPPVTRTADGLRIEPTLTRGRGPKPLLVPAPLAPRIEPTMTAQPMTEMMADMDIEVPLEPLVDMAAYDYEQPVEAPVEAAPRKFSFNASGWDDMDEADLLVDEDNIFAEAVDLQPAGMPRLAAEPLPRVSAAPVAEPRKVVQHAPKRPLVQSRQAQAEAQPALRFEDNAHQYECPPLNLLMDPAEITRHHLSDEALEENARMLESVLDDYGIKGEIVSVRPGPVVTMYELEPAPGLKASRVIGLADDIARSMSALSARVSTVPGRSVIGIELPNENREKVVLREILSARDFGDSNMRLPLALGKDIGGDAVVANLAKMPHLLIAGTTGSGKSVAINTMILSLLYKLTPEECRLIMIDPKMLELSVYDGIPHLLSPVVTDPKKAVVALKWVVGEMEERYRKMSKMGVRNIDGYNGRVRDALARGEMFERTVQTGFDEETGDPIFETEELKPVPIPYIVVIVDEMADLMMVAGKEIEACIQRLAQMARASGIHLIMATQRPSVDVITGTIKANFPTRISFQVTSKIDSRTILGEQGAEQLLGMGDMLYMAGGSKITRVHGPFVSDEEVEEIVNYLKGFGPPEYMSGVVEGPDEDREADIDAVLGLNSGGNTDTEDALYDTAVAIVIKDRKCSTSYIQRKLAIGYNKAARLVEQMEEQGVVSAANHVGKREILVPEQH